MKIHHLRNATFVIETGQSCLLIDPMLGERGSIAPYARFRHRARKNPLVSLPANAAEILDRVTNCVLTHSQKFGIKAFQHTDHLDAAGESFLRERRIPIATLKRDVAFLERSGLIIEAALDYWQTVDYLGGKITAVPALHGRGWVHRLMANGAGFHLQLPGEPSIYISGDTVYTTDVERALTEFEPEIAVMASGSASLDLGGPILMPIEELITFARRAPGKVVANHLEALNHCPTTRSELSEELDRNGLLSKVLIPDDGEVMTIETSL